MAFTSSTARFEPMGVGAILDRTFRLYGDNLALVLGIVGVGNLIPIGLLLLLYVLPYELAEAVIYLQRAAVFLLAPFVKGAVAFALSERYLGHETSVMAAFARAWSRFAFILGTQILVFFWVAVGVVMLIVPGILWALSYALVIPVVTLEPRKPSEALQRSWDLTHGERGKVFSVTAVANLLLFLVSAGVSGLVAATVGFGTWDGVVLGTLAPQLVSIVIEPINHIASLLLYYDMRIRKEGFDLEMLGQEMARG